MNKIKVVGILQNAWSPYYAPGPWPRESWLRALDRSRTGQRLKLLGHESIEYWWDETTPVVADNPRTVIPADFNYMRSVLNEQQPKFIITFGMPAMNAMITIKEEFKQPVICLPHPTYRVVTNQLFLDARDHIVKGFEGWIRYKQAIGKIDVIKM